MSAREEVKPAGTEADERSVAAMFALWKSRDFYFGGISDLWKSCTLQRGLLYIRKSDNMVFVSLGFMEYVAIGWGLERVYSKSSEKNFFTTPKCTSYNDAKGNIFFLSCTGLSGRNITDQSEEFAGIPFKFSCLILDFILIVILQFEMSNSCYFCQVSE